MHSVFIDVLQYHFSLCDCFGKNEQPFHFHGDWSFIYYTGELSLA